MKLLSLELEVAGHDHDAQEHEGIPHEGIWCASVHAVGELLQAQEVEGLVGSLVEEVQDEKQRARGSSQAMSRRQIARRSSGSTYEGFEGLSNGDVSKSERLAQVREQRLHDAFAGCVLLLPDRTG